MLGRPAEKRKMKKRERCGLFHKKAKHTSRHKCSMTSHVKWKLRNVPTTIKRRTHLVRRKVVVFHSISLVIFLLELLFGACLPRLERKKLRKRKEESENGYNDRESDTHYVEKVIQTATHFGMRAIVFAFDVTFTDDSRAPAGLGRRPGV